MSANDTIGLLSRRVVCTRGLLAFFIVLLLVMNLTLLLVASMASTGAAPVATLNSVAVAAVLRVGLTLDYPPFSFRCADGSAAGADVDAASDLAASLGVALDIVPTSWTHLMADAAALRFDVAGGGISITLERMRQVGFSKARVHGGKVVVAPCGAHELLSLWANASSLPEGTTVAVNPGGTNEAYVWAHWADARVILVEQGAQYDALLDGTADLTVTDSTEAQLMSARHARRLCVGSAQLTREDKALLLPRASDVPWSAYVNRWLEERQASGAEAAALDGWLAQLAATNESSRACSRPPPGGRGPRA